MRFDTSVVQQFKPLRTSNASSVEVVVTEGRGGRRVDIRTYVSGEAYVGPTKKGVNLDLAEFEALLDQKEAILAALRGKASVVRGPGQMALADVAAGEVRSGRAQARAKGRA